MYAVCGIYSRTSLLRPLELTMEFGRKREVTVYEGGVMADLLWVVQKFLGLLVDIIDLPDFTREC